MTLYGGAKMACSPSVLEVRAVAHYEALHLEKRAKLLSHVVVRRRLGAGEVERHQKQPFRRRRTRTLTQAYFVREGDCACMRRTSRPSHVWRRR